MVQILQKNTANFKGHQCLLNKRLGVIKLKKGPSLAFLREKADLL